MTTTTTTIPPAIVHAFFRELARQAADRAAAARLGQQPPSRQRAEVSGSTPERAAAAPPTTIRIDTAIQASAGDYHSWPDWPLWHCIGLHEQGAARGGPYDTHGDGIAWAGSPAGGLPGSGYPGGLGIMRAAWDDARGEAGVTVANGAYASPGEQIRVARVIKARHGLGAWATAGICG